MRNLQALQAKLGFDRESQKDLAKRAAEQRRTDMHRLAGEFEAAIGNIIETVASAATELEAAAGTLTHTAEIDPAALDRRRIRLGRGVH